MFADKTTAARVERAEAAVMRAMVRGLVGSDRAPRAFLRELGPGVASFVRAGSPMNKMIGVGLDGTLDEGALGALEGAYHAEKEPVRAEVATLAAPEALEQLNARGYRLMGFENVLGTPLRGDAPPRDGAIRVERVTTSTLTAYRDAVVEGASHPDDTGVVLDQFTREVVATVVDDTLPAAGAVRYVAYRDGQLAGGASLHVHDGVAVFTGSATLPAHRRRGVQAAFLATRLDEARTLGAEWAIITTAPGTQSMANVMKHGFALIYARAVLVRS
jgi:GNAT superfamily N-acetyltransferase